LPARQIAAPKWKMANYFLAIFLPIFVSFPLHFFIPLWLWPALAIFQLSIILLTAVRFGHIRGSDFSTPMTSSSTLLQADVAAVAVAADVVAAATATGCSWGCPLMMLAHVLRPEQLLPFVIPSLESGFAIDRQDRCGAIAIAC